jgi:hypothetical protein
MQAHLETRHKVSSRVERGILGMAPLRCAHTVVVVLTHKDDGDVPQGRHVKSLVLLALWIEVD